MKQIVHVKTFFVKFFLHLSKFGNTQVYYTSIFANTKAIFCVTVDKVLSFLSFGKL